MTSADGEKHHEQAAGQNSAVAIAAEEVVLGALSGENQFRRFLLKAAAGAGKSFVLRRLVASAVGHPGCKRVAVVAFTHKQTYPLAEELGRALGRDKVCLFVSDRRIGDVPQSVSRHAQVTSGTSNIGSAVEVVVSTVHKLGAPGEVNRQISSHGTGANGQAPFDVLFCDEAWQVAHHLWDGVAKAAPIWVGVGDVGQLPPLEIGTNPWRGDENYNPYRAWPTVYSGAETTWERELPAVWRPTAPQLDMWRAFYPEWAELSCVAAEGDRVVELKDRDSAFGGIWSRVASGRPVLLEVDGLAAADIPDVDEPLLGFLESALDDLLEGGFALVTAEYDGAGVPTGEYEVRGPGDDGDPLIAILATRNEAVDMAENIAERLRQKHGLTSNDVIASTVDSWQGQTNGITVALHPLSGAQKLDDFNSAFGRLAVVATRATHGLLLFSRPDLDGLLRDAPARAGTPLGEPGNRRLPRQTHEAILRTFERRTAMAAAC
jgi:hypothetical protein